MISQRLVEDGIIQGNSLLTLPEGESAEQSLADHSISAVEKAALRMSSRVSANGGQEEQEGQEGQEGKGEMGGVVVEMLGEKGHEKGEVVDETKKGVKQWEMYLQKTLECLRKVGGHYIYRGIFLLLLAIDLLLLGLAVLGFNEYRLW